MEVYQALAEKLDQYPTGAPKTDHLLKILETLFTEQEAGIASRLSLQPFREKLSVISERLGVAPAALQPVLETLADKGLVFARPKDGEMAYSLLPLVPGIFELQFMKAGYDPKSRALAKLFDDYYFAGWGRASFEFKTSFTRTIPIEKAVAPGQSIEPYRNVKEIIENSKYLALTNCFCRHEHELLGTACGKPKEVCMIFGPFTEHAVARGFARKASKQEMLDKLLLSEEAGLVHITDNIRDKISFICNCCGCCCGFLSAINKLNLPSVVANSGFVVEVDDQKCDNCGRCVKRCQVKALWLEDNPDFLENKERKDKDDKKNTKKLLKMNLGRCIGCGLCVSACKQEAVIMKRRPQDQVAAPRASFEELGMELMKERNERGR